MDIRVVLLWRLGLVFYRASVAASRLAAWLHLRYLDCNHLSWKYQPYAEEDA